MTAIKFADDGIVEGLAVAWGSPSRRDAQGEYFTSETDFGLDLIEGPRPVLLHHGLSPAGPAVIGRITAIEKRAEGLWIRAQLDRASKWWGEVKALLARGALGFSSGTLAHLRRMGLDGQIVAWPLVEVSLTPSPSDPEARIYAVKFADLEAHLAAVRTYTSKDREELRAIGDRLTGRTPHRGLVMAGMGVVDVRQPETDRRVAHS